MNRFKKKLPCISTLGLMLMLPAVGWGQVSFENDVWPILQQRCLECHQQERAAGDLVFDRGRNAAERGGHTGQPIFGTSASDSELIRRIVSGQPDYRMPKQNPPLSQADIAILTAWVDQGAPWSSVGNHSGVRDLSESGPIQLPSAKSSNQPDSELAKLKGISSADPASSLADALVWFESQMQDQGFRGFVYLAIALVLTLIGLVVYLKRFSTGFHHVTRLQSVAIVLLVFLCAATYVHYDAKYKMAVQQLESIRAQLVTYVGPVSGGDPLWIPHPMHPPRLGGVYYRGNDERSDRLFNGGFYRTAELEIWLTDRDGMPLKWGDTVDGPLSVEFVIKRSPHTSSHLFSDHIMSVIGLCREVVVNTRDNRQHSKEVSVGRVIPMTAVEADQQWRSRFPIEKFHQSVSKSDTVAAGESITQGNLYVVQNTSKPKVHYGVEYEIRLDNERRILPSSKLWMGSIYNLNGRVFVPRQGEKILLDRWFDFRPIPEISSPQTDDPELLGIPEHQ
jgi:hypothetical protein